MNDIDQLIELFANGGEDNKKTAFLELVGNTYATRLKRIRRIDNVVFQARSGAVLLTLSTVVFLLLAVADGSVGETVAVSVPLLGFMPFFLYAEYVRKTESKVFYEEAKSVSEKIPEGTFPELDATVHSAIKAKLPLNKYAALIEAFFSNPK